MRIKKCIIQLSKDALPFRAWEDVTLEEDDISKLVERDVNHFYSILEKLLDVESEDMYNHYGNPLTEEKKTPSDKLTTDYLEHIIIKELTKTAGKENIEPIKKTKNLLYEFSNLYTHLQMQLNGGNEEVLINYALNEVRKDLIALVTD